MRQMAEIESNAKAAEHREDPTRQRSTDGDHQQIDTAVQKLAELAIRAHAGQSAPEGEHAKDVEPEGEVLRLVGSHVDEEREQRHCEAEKR